VVTIAGLYFFYRVRIILIPFIFAFFLAYVLNPVVETVEERGLSRSISILVVYAAVSIMFTLLIMFGVPKITGELNKLGRAVPGISSEVYEVLRIIETKYSRFALPEGIKQVLDDHIAGLEKSVINITKEFTEGLIKTFSYLWGFLIAPILAYYVLKDIDRIKQSFVLTIPRRYRADTMAIMRDIDDILKGFLKGHLLISVIVGILTGTGMYLIGLEFAFLIGILAGIAELIPYLGPFLSGIPSIGLALLESKKTAIFAGLVILTVQQLENAVISPKILSKSMGLHPLVLLFALLAGGELFGFIGVLIAVPAAAVLKVILRYVYLKLVDDK